MLFKEFQRKLEQIFRDNPSVVWSWASIAVREAGLQDAVNASNADEVRQRLLLLPYPMADRSPGGKAAIAVDNAQHAEIYGPEIETGRVLAVSVVQMVRT